MNKVELNESDFLWNPSREYFSDDIHPCRLPFDAHLNYERSADGVFADNDEQRQYRLGNIFQMIFTHADCHLMPI